MRACRCHKVFLAKSPPFYKMLLSPPSVAWVWYLLLWWYCSNGLQKLVSRLQYSGFQPSHTSDLCMYNKEKLYLPLASSVALESRTLKPCGDMGVPEHSKCPCSKPLTLGVHSRKSSKTTETLPSLPFIGRCLLAMTGEGVLFKSHVKNR